MFDKAAIDRVDWQSMGPDLVLSDFVMDSPSSCRLSVGLGWLVLLCLADG